MNCICQNAPQRPGVTEVLDSLQQHTVCTDTACYEGEEAAFGVTAGQSAAPSNQNMFFMFMTFMMFVAMMLRMQRPSPQLTSKAGSSSSHANQPPPGPPPPPPAPEVD